MQAIHIEHYIKDVTQIKPMSLPIPRRQAQEHLVRVTHCSPQHADILHAQGRHQNNNPKRGHIHPPFILGYNFAGIIEEAEPAQNGSRSFKKGDRVFGAKIGAFAEFICVKADQIWRVPDGVDSASACALSGQMVSYAAAKEIANIQSGEWVAVSGASGGLGSGCCAVAKALGAKVIALTENEEKARLMRRDMDVDHVVVMKNGWANGILDITNGRGVHVVLDNTGMVNDALRCLTYEGRIVLLGFAARDGVMEEVKMNKILLKSASIIGFRFGEFGRRSPRRLEAVSRDFLRMVKTGKLKPLLYGSYHGIGDISRALKDLEDRKVYGKVVVTMSSDVEKVAVKSQL